MSWKDDGNFSTLEDIQAYGDARAEAERGRIIALLENVPDMGVSDWADGYHEALEEAIALIKGEQK